MAIENKLNKLKETKQNIKSAIENKGQTVGDIPFAQYAKKISEIEVGDDNIFPAYTDEDGLEEANTVSARYIKANAEEPYSGYELEVYSSSGLFNKFSTMLDNGVFLYSGIAERAKKVKLINAKITNLTFWRMGQLEEIEGLETVETLGQHTFSYCYKLYLDGNFPSVKYVNNAFANYENLPSEVNFPRLERTSYDIYMSKSERVRTVNMGSPGFPFKTAGAQTFKSCDFITNINIYVSDPSNPGLIGAPWGATNATITYLQA